MSDGKILVRFTKDAFEERAHPKDSQRGGFSLHKIPAGTKMHMKPRSVEFWRARDVDLLEVIPDEHPRPVAPVVPVTPAERPVIQVHENPNAWPDDRKTALRQAIDAALTGAGSVADVRAFDLSTLHGVDPADVVALDDPFRYPEALRALRRLVPARRGRKPRV
jgi:hypothetical protein